MSRIGKQPVALPSGVKVTVQDRTVTVQGKGGTLTFQHRPEVTVRVEDNAVVVERANDERKNRAFHGMTRALIANMVKGVTEGFAKELEIVGAGWNAQLQGNRLNLNVGHADTKVVEVPMGVTVEVQGPRIKVSGADKQAVGQTAAVIRGKRPPEPYNGKGIKYADEQITRKQGKQFAGGAG
jgi:large subunit ribosomal protein L6